MKEEKSDDSLLGQINSPRDLKKLPVERLPQVCKEIRHEIIDVLSHHPGHLASSLGAVELAVALHYTLDTPDDRIVWDVGHQAYAHKILTGRRDRFKTNRQLGGLRPFPSPLESEYDTCTCGHASNSISIALGMAVAAIREKSNRRVAAVIGDGAMSGGLAFEGINNVSSTPNNMLIILNDNHMSIDKSVGGMKKILYHLHTSPTYNTLRFKAAQKFADWGWLTEHRKRTILRFNNSIKSLLFNQQNIFEGFDIRYFGPTDGNDVIELVRIINEIKDMKGPKLLHVHTVKGKGYQAAEREATVWHFPGPFDAESGQRIIKQEKNCPPKYQKVFGETVLELARSNDKIVGVTPAMPTGCSLDIMMKEMPDRVFDVGIAEGHAVTFSAGMAKDGLVPFCNIYSSFAQRAYDNIIHDVAILGLPVVICLDRAGLVGEDGPTHHGAFDMAALRPIPHLTIASPMDEHELRNLMYTAQLPGNGTFVIRYPRGACEHADWHNEFEEIEVGKGRLIKAGTDLAVLTVGPVGNKVGDAINKVGKFLNKVGTNSNKVPSCFDNMGNNSHDIPTDANRTPSDADKVPPAADEIALKSRIAHYDMRFIKPLDTALLDEIAKKYRRIITIEDGVRKGGFGSGVLEYFAEKDLTTHVRILGLPDDFVQHGPVNDLYRIVGLDSDGIAKAMAEELELISKTEGV